MPYLAAKVSKSTLSAQKSLHALCCADRGRRCAPSRGQAGIWGRDVARGDTHTAHFYEMHAAVRSNAVVHEPVSRFRHLLLVRKTYNRRFASLRCFHTKKHYWTLATPSFSVSLAPP